MWCVRYHTEVIWPWWLLCGADPAFTISWFVLLAMASANSVKVWIDFFCPGILPFSCMLYSVNCGYIFMSFNWQWALLQRPQICVFSPIMCQQNFWRAEQILKLYHVFWLWHVTKSFLVIGNDRDIFSVVIVLLINKHIRCFIHSQKI